MSRRVYLLGVAVALVALGLAVTDWILSLQPGVTEANARRIRPGMTLPEVEQRLGGPGKLVGGRFIGVFLVWEARTGIVGVAIEPHDLYRLQTGRRHRARVAWAKWEPFSTEQPGFLDRLRACLGG